MKKRLLLASMTLLFTSTLFSNVALSRNIFLNGIDISSATGQELKNVTIRINEKGDVFIVAPHYQVNEEDTYVPLSKYVQGVNLPTHKKPTEIPVKTLIPKAGAPEKTPAMEEKKVSDEKE